MKKVLILGMLASMLSAGEFKSEVILGGASINGNSGGVLGYGYTFYGDNKVMTGVDLSVFCAGHKIGGYDIDLKLGASDGTYGAYVLGSFGANYTDEKDINGKDGNTAFGIGVGGGVEAKGKNVAVAVEYKNFDMQSDLKKSNMEIVQVLFKYFF